jgi:copper(I)-binding protein
MHRLALLLVFACLTACSVEQAPLLAEDVVVTRPLPGVRMGAGYLTLRNTTSQKIVISRVSSPDFESVKMHESVLEDGISRMYELQEVVILSGRSVTFEPGGKHLMMRHPVDTPARVTLQFYAGKAMILSLDVVPEE